MAGRKPAAIILNDDEQFDRTTLVRLAVWGASAVIMLGAALWAARAELGTKQADAAIVATAPPEAVTRLEQHADELERDVRQMSDALRILMADRERLMLRIGMIERSLGDLTGSLAREPSTNPDRKTAESKPEAEKAQSESKPSGEPQSRSEAKAATETRPPETKRSAEAAPPVDAAPATVAPAAESTATATPPPVALMPAADAPAKPLGKIVPAPAPVAAAAVATAKPMAAIAAVTPTAAPPATAAAPTVGTAPPAASIVPASPPPPVAEAAKTNPAEVVDQTQPPQTTGSIQTPVPLPRVPPASAIPDDNSPPIGIGGGSGATMGVSDYGVDLGPALSLNRLRSRWKSLKTVYGTLFDGLRPVVAIRENHKGWPLEMHLIVGPFPTAVAAGQFCAAIVRTQYSCQPAAFDGQRLALR